MALETLHCTASVYVNGIFCGDIWKRPFRLDIAKALRPGKNKLQLEVRSTIINTMLSPEIAAAETEEAPLLDVWPYFGETINKHLRERWFNWREREYFKEPQPAGLTGKVMLLIYQ